MFWADVVTFFKAHYPAILSVWVVLVALVARRTGDAAWAAKNPELNLLCETGRSCVLDLIKLERAFRAYVAIRGPDIRMFLAAWFPLLVLLFAPFASGCVGSLETARNVRNSKTLQAPGPVVRPKECATLDSIHVWSGGGAEVSIGVGVGAGILAASAKSEAWQDRGIAVGLGAAVAAGTLGYWSQWSGKTWTERCSL
jgi:hypothetical protein